MILDDHVGLGEGALDVADDRADLRRRRCWTPSWTAGPPALIAASASTTAGQRLVLDADGLGTRRPLDTGRERERRRSAHRRSGPRRGRAAAAGAACRAARRDSCGSARAAGSGSASSGRSSARKTATPGSARAVVRVDPRRSAHVRASNARARDGKSRGGAMSSMNRPRPVISRSSSLRRGD